MAYKSSLRGTRPVSLLGVHSAEGSRTARSLAAYFWREDIAASSHAAIDATETLELVPYSRAAWTMRSANPISDNVELCAFARWTRAQWLGSTTVDGCANPREMLRRLSAWIAQRCIARGIPCEKLTVVQLGAGRWGVIAHGDWTIAMRDGSHTDPGTGFPWDVVINDARTLVEIYYGRTPAAPEWRDEDVILLVNLDEPDVRYKYAIYSGGMMSGYPHDLADQAIKSGKLKDIGVPGVVWRQYQEKSRNLEFLNANFKGVHDLLREIRDALTATPPAGGGESA